MTTQLDLMGQRVRLRTTTALDAAPLVAIRRSEEVRRRWRGDDLDAEFAADLADDSCHQLTITADGDVVGMIQFAEADDEEYRHASIDIYIDPAVHRRGYASDAIATLADHLFDDRGHHRITIDPVRDNLAAIACYRGVGFRTVGVMRSYERQGDGSWADGLLMEMLASDRTGAAVASLAFAGTVVNARNPDELAAFYERLLGWDRFMDDGDWVAIRAPGGGTAIAFQLDPAAVAPQWPSHPGHQHTLLHLDFVTADLADAVAHAVEAGAVLTDARANDDECVLLDPAGHPFCLIQSTT